MNKDLFVRAYLYPELSRYIEKTRSIKENGTASDYINALNCHFSISSTFFEKRQNLSLQMIPPSNDLLILRTIVFLLYRRELFPDIKDVIIEFNGFYAKKDAALFKKEVFPVLSKKFYGAQASFSFISGPKPFIRYIKDGKMCFETPPNDLSESYNRWLCGSRVSEEIWKEHQLLRQLHEKLSDEHERKEKSLDDILRA